MNRISLLTSLFVLIFLVPSITWAKISVSLKLDRSQTQLVDSVQLTVSVIGSRDSESMSEIQGLMNFDVKSAGRASQSVSINGKTSLKIDHIFYLQPQKIGTFQIGPARVLADGKHYTSNTAKLKVVKPGKGQPERLKPVFITAELSRDTVYVEEQTVYTLKVYRRPNVGKLRLTPFEIENISLNQIGEQTSYRGSHDGREYEVIELRYALLPTKPGSYVINPAVLNSMVYDPRKSSRRSFWNDPFPSFSRGRPLRVSSQAMQLTVLPLPEAGKPQDFSGLVGKFKMQSRLEPASLKTGESATLTVSVSGQGNVNRIPDLKIPELNQIKIYADKPMLESAQDGEGTRGSKTMKWALVPEKEGRLEVPAVAVSFFDTETQRYRTLKSSPYTLTVLSGEKETINISEPNAAPQNDEGAQKQTIRELGCDIFPIHTALQGFKTAGRLDLENLLLRALLGLPLIIYLGTLGGLKLRRNSRAGQPDLMAKKAAREFFKQYRKGELPPGRLLALIRDYLNRRFGLSYGALTPRESVEILILQGVGRETAEDLQNAMQQLEIAEYTGQGTGTAAVDIDLVPIIKRIEKESR